MNKENKRTTDLVFSIVLMITALWFGIKSVMLFSNPFSKAASMLTEEEINKNLADWFQSPGLVPLIFSILLMICAIYLFVIAWKTGARFDFITKENIARMKENKELHVAVKVIGLLFVYIYIDIPLCRKFLNLIPKFQGFPFMIATFIYLSVFIIIFNEKTKKKIMISFVVAAIGAVLITLAFGVAAKILLP